MSDGIEITTDASRIYVDRVHAWISGSYRAPGIPKEVVKKSIEESIVICHFHGRNDK